MRVYVAIPVPRANPKFKPSHMMRWDCAGISIRPFSCGGAPPGRGYLLYT
jgi:hypothetical protein